jgi:hypothetical protein
MLISSTRGLPITTVGVRTYTRLMLHPSFGMLNARMLNAGILNTVAHRLFFVSLSAALQFTS